MRRDFQLSEDDEASLAARGLAFETVIEANAKLLIIPAYPIPAGYNHTAATLALRIPPSYPDEQIDMVYFLPALALTRAKAIGQLSMQPLDGRQFQQWSRHRTEQNPWRAGLDSICTHLLQVDCWLKRELNK